MAGQPPIAPYDPRDYPPQLRATDAEREHVAGLVRSAVGDGRIQLDELDDRLGAAYKAKTHGELSVVIDDIVPRASHPVPRPSTGVPAQGTSDRLILPAFLLCLFFGMFGAHRFYTRNTKSAITMLVLTLVAIGAPVTFVWHLVDLVRLGIGHFRDGGGGRMRRWT
jgi:hypothetical protein